MKDYTIIALAFNEEIRIYASVSTKLVEKSRKFHQTLPTSSAAMGRFLTASAMMSLMYKDGERLALKIDGDGPIGTMTVDAKNGVVKSTIQNPGVHINYNSGPKAGKLAVGPAVGKGFLHVTKDWNGNFFTSSSPLQTGEIAEDFTYYYAASEQTPSAVGLGVLVHGGQKVILAGGYIIQVLPHCTNQTLDKLEDILKGITSVTEILKDEQTPEHLLNTLTNGDHRILETREIKYHCGCTKAKYKKSINSLNLETLQEIQAEDKQAEVVCPYCNKKHLFDYNDLQILIDKKLARKNK